jgi:hypothetical protein
MLAKGKSLTLYEPGPQYISPGLQRTRSEPMSTTHNTSYTTTPPTIYWPTVSMLPPAGSFRSWNGSGATQVDFRMPCTDATRIAGTPPKVPPDGGTTTVLSSMVHDIATDRAVVGRYPVDGNCYAAEDGASLPASDSHDEEPVGPGMEGF